nr:uncharacterized protein CTRU02_11326 [Colletotrichum truncatum]KAF6786068.1 hypothetical protein CTRU02_11326 [Colletotrichum truncatum]
MRFVDESSITLHVYALGQSSPDSQVPSPLLELADNQGKRLIGYTFSTHEANVHCALAGRTSAVCGFVKSLLGNVYVTAGWPDRMPELMSIHAENSDVGPRKCSSAIA